MSYIRSGSVFVWEESDDDTGLRRWTDGLLWSASRMREVCLSLVLLALMTTMFPSYSHSFSMRQGRSTLGKLGLAPLKSFILQYGLTPNLSSSYPSSNVPGLVKQTYSAIVTLPSSDVPPGMTPIRKWHLTAYFEHDDLPSLLTIDTDQDLSNITVPSGVFRSGKSRTRQQPSSQESSGGLRWINVDGSTGMVTSSATSGSGRQSLDISPEGSVASSPSQSPTFRPSSHGMARGSGTPYIQHSSPRPSSSGSWGSGYPSSSSRSPELLH